MLKSRPYVKKEASKPGPMRIHTTRYTSQMKEEEASATAYTVMAGLWYASRKPAYGDLISSEARDTCEKILAATPQGRRWLQLLGGWWAPTLVSVLEWLTMRGITLHYALRKRKIEDYVLRAIEEGHTQIINLGAGFDTLALRLSKRHPEVQFIEIDHPATQESKIVALDDDILGRDNLALLAVDLAKIPLAWKLRHFRGFKPDRSTCYICEGVLTYLEEADVVQLLTYLKNLNSKKTMFIFTATDTQDKLLESFGPVARLYLTSLSEPLRWVKGSDQIGDFLEANDFALEDLATHRELGEAYLAPEQRSHLHTGEYIVEAVYAP